MELRQTRVTPLPWGHITEHTTSIVCTIIVTNLIVNILLLTEEQYEDLFNHG